MTPTHKLSQAFRARLKAIAKGVSFYNTKGESVDMISFIEDVKNFDPDAVDDDLGGLPQASFEPQSGKKSTAGSSAEPQTECSKRKRM